MVVRGWISPVPTGLAMAGSTSWVIHRLKTRASSFRDRMIREYVPYPLMMYCFCFRPIASMR